MLFKKPKLNFEKKKFTHKHWIFLGIIVIFFITYGYLMTKGGNSTTDAQWLKPFIEVPAFSCKDTQGNTITNDIFKDNIVTFTYVWKATDDNCVRNISAVKAVAKDMSDMGVGVIGIIIDYKGNEKVVDSLLSSKGVTFPNIIPDEALYNSLVKRCEVVPTSYMIDANGTALSGDILSARKEGEYYDIIKALLGAMQRSGKYDMTLAQPID